MLHMDPDIAEQSRWLFTEKTIFDTKHDVTYDIEGTLLCHCPVEEALSIWYDGQHEDTVPCDSATFNSTLYQFEQTESYIPLVIKLKIKDTEGKQWSLSKGVLCHGENAYDLQSLNFELSGNEYVVSSKTKHLCTVSALDGEAIMRAKKTHHDHQHEKVERLEREGDVIEEPEEMIDTEIMITTETALDIPVEKRITIISAEAAYGMNIFKEWFMTISDKLGGRNSSIQNTLKDAREEVLQELKEEAKLVGADAVIGIDLDYSEFSGAGRSMLFVVATGTAVKLKST